MDGQAWAPLEALRAPWPHRPVPQTTSQLPTQEDRDALAKQRAMNARRAFIAERQAGRLHRDGEAVELHPVASFHLPVGPPKDLETMRNELRNEMLAMEESPHPKMVMARLARDREEEGPFLICERESSYDGKTVEVLRASDLQQSTR